MPEIQWHDFPGGNAQVAGLPFFAENTPELWRLPQSAKGKVREAVWNLALHCSGGRIRFNTNATDLKLKLKFATPDTMHNMSNIGQMGIDVVVDGQSWIVVWPKDPDTTEFEVFTGIDARAREVTLYLPLYHNVRVDALGVNSGATIDAPKPFAIAKPVVYYGSSITQGGCASRAGLSYQAILHRRIDADFVNLGFSGNGKGEPELAELVAEIDAACFVMDFAQNLETVDDLETVYLPFLNRVREKRPDTPMICVTPIHSDREYWQQGARDKLSGQRDVIRSAVGERKQQGDKNIALVEGHSLISPDNLFSFVDGAHPNDLGFTRMADGLEPALRDALQLRA